MSREQSRLTGPLRFVAIMAFGGLFGFVLAKSGEGSLAYLKPLKEAYPSLKIWLLLSFPIIAFLVIAIHELGHVIAGKLAGLEFQSMTVFVVKVEKRNGKLRLGVNTSLNTMGGLAVLLPTTTENLRSRFFRFIAGGPVASVLLAVICFGTFTMLPTVSLARPFLQFTGFLSAVIAMATLLPLPGGKGFKTDGRRMLDLTRGGPETDVEIANLTSLAHLRANRNPGELEIELLDAAIGGTDGRDASVAILHYLKYAYHVARDELVSAETSLNRYVEMMDVFPDGLHSAIWSDAALFAAICRQDHESAKNLREKVKPNGLLDKAQLNLLDAAIATLGNEQTAAREYIAASRSFLPETMLPGIGQLYEKWLSELEARLAWHSP